MPILQDEIWRKTQKLLAAGRMRSTLFGYTVFEAVSAQLARIGYIHEGDLGIREREAFRYSGKPHLMQHHLYVCPKSSEELARHIRFRDFLRSDPAARSEK